MPVARDLTETKEIILPNDYEEAEAQESEGGAESSNGNAPKGEPKPDATTWIIGIIPGRHFVKFEALMSRSIVVTPGEMDGEKKVKFTGDTEALEEMIRWGLKGWKNFRDAKGADVPFKTVRGGLVSEESLDMIPGDSYISLAMAIHVFNRNSPDDLEN